MQSHLSPKDLALLIGVSESSLKRWVDDGRLRAERTAGGHRRIAMAEAVRFIRETASAIADPALMRLPELDQNAVDAAQNGEAEREILSAARGRNTARATGILIAEFLRSRAVAAVCDGPMTMLLNQAEQKTTGGGFGLTRAPGTAAAICKETTQRISVLLAEPRADALSQSFRRSGRPPPGQERYGRGGLARVQLPRHRRSTCRGQRSCRARIARVHGV